MTPSSNFTWSNKRTVIFLIAIISVLFFITLMTRSDQFTFTTYSLVDKLSFFPSATDPLSNFSIPLKWDQNEDEIILIENPNTHTYEFNGKPIIWEYWHSPDLPLYVRLLVQAMQCRNPEFQVITVHDTTIYKYLPDLGVPENVLQALSGNHKGDLFRVPILHKYGGIYTDIDTFVLDKAYPAYDLLRKYHIITPKWGDEIFALGALGPVRANTSLFGELRRKQLKLLDDKFPGYFNGTRFDQPPNDPLGWGELMLGQTSGVEHTVGPDKTVYRAYDGGATVGQLVFQGLMEDVWTPFNNVSHKIIPLRSTPFLFLHHGKMKERFWNIKRIDQLLPSNPTIYSAFVGCALLDCLQEFENLAQKSIDAETARTRINVKELVESLKVMDRETCYKLNRRRDTYFLERLSADRKSVV